MKFQQTNEKISKRTNGDDFRDASLKITRDTLTGLLSPRFKRSPRMAIISINLRVWTEGVFENGQCFGAVWLSSKISTFSPSSRLRRFLNWSSENSDSEQEPWKLPAQLVKSLRSRSWLKMHKVEWLSKECNHEFRRARVGGKYQGIVGAILINFKCSRSRWLWGTEAEKAIQHLSIWLYRLCIQREFGFNKSSALSDHLEVRLMFRIIYYDFSSIIAS